MNKQTTKAIVLKRVDYGDYDRIITVLTPNFGRLSLMAKGVRKINSKLAGGIELFSVFDAGFIVGRGDVYRLTSSRLDEFYGDILKSIERVQLGYEILKAFNRNIEDNVENDYFYRLCQLLRLLNEPDISLTKLELYFKSSLLQLAGHAPNLLRDENNQALNEKSKYNFNILKMNLSQANSGRLAASHIKILRMLFDDKGGQQIFRLKLNHKEDQQLVPLIDAMFRTHLSV